MKHRLSPALFALALAATTGCAHTVGSIDRETRVVTSGPYYDELAPYGTWFDLAPYGPVWSPDYEAGWRPYTLGRWVYTDLGWMWLSTDRFGGAPYHYGRWTFDASYGWIWVPNSVWAPSWASWRYGDGWVGWAPLPPGSGWQTGLGLRWTNAEIDSRLDPSLWTFVPERDFTSATNLDHHVAPVSRNTTLLAHTQNFTRYENAGSRPAEHGFTPALFRHGDPKVIRYQVVERTTPSDKRLTWVHGGEIDVYTPTASTTVIPAQSSGRTREMLEETSEHHASEERARMEKHLADERERLVREQRHEMRNVPRGVSVAELRARHDAELRAQDAVERRERQVFENRTRALRRMAEEREARENRPPQPPAEIPTPR